MVNPLEYLSLCLIFKYFACIISYFMNRVNRSEEKAMATHSSTLARKVPWMEEPGRLQSTGLLGVGPDFTFTFHFHALEKEMATHSSTLAGKVSWTEEPGRLQSMGSLGVGHDFTFTFMHWRIPGTGEPGGLPSMGSHRVRHD